MNLQQSLDLRRSWLEEKGNINRMTMQIEVRGNKIFYNAKRNKVNRLM